MAIMKSGLAAIIRILAEEAVSAAIDPASSSKSSDADAAEPTGVHTFDRPCGRVRRQRECLEGVTGEHDEGPVVSL